MADQDQQKSIEQKLVKNADGRLNNKNPWADDKLQRKAVADRLTKILNTVTQPFVVGLDSQFGSGKTFFIKRWARQLKNDGANVVYFNAWETDFAHDPLMAFLATLEKDLFAGRLEKEYRDDMRKAAKALWQRISLNIVEQVTVALVKTDDVAAVMEAMKPLQSERYDAFKSAQTEIGDFRSKLLQCGKTLREADEDDRPIIIFVDELDRCRPDYAIQVLEIIKHFFNIENYVLFWR
jgi:predicted KAP-like P-loop ATPase